MEGLTYGRTERHIPPVFYRTSSPLGLQPKNDKNLISLSYLINLKTFLIGALYSGVVFRCYIQVTLTELEIQYSTDAILFWITEISRFGATWTILCFLRQQLNRKLNNPMKLTNLTYKCHDFACFWLLWAYWDPWRGLLGVSSLDFHLPRASLYHLTITELKNKLSLEIGSP